MHRIYKKEYNLISRSFLTRAFFGTIVASSLFACGGVSKEELAAVKEETEKVKKELGDKIIALEGRAPAAITAANYTHIQAAVGLDADGHLEPTVGGSLAKDVAELKAFKTAIQANIGLDAMGEMDYTANGSLAEYVGGLGDFKTAIQASVGLDADGNLEPTVGGSLAEDVAGLKTFKTGTQANVGLDDDGYLTNEGLAKDVAVLKNRVAALPTKILAGVNALGGRIELADGTYAQITSADL